MPTKRHEIIQPPGWTKPKGYSNGIRVAPGAAFVFVAGQVAWDERARIVGEDDFVEQFRQALSNVLTVVREAGGVPEDIVRLTIYVRDKERYVSSLSALTGVWRALMGRHYPVMALVEVSALVEPGALLEIEGTAAIYSEEGRGEGGVS